jgi:hypothetical protein
MLFLYGADMLYLVVNNDFHLTNLLNQKHNFEGMDICVIRVPYNLKKECSNLAQRIKTIKTPYNNFREFINPQKFQTAKREVDEIYFCAEDVVVFLTEYDPINQYIIYSAKNSGARTILLEEGIATYYNNIPIRDVSFSIKNAIKIFYLKYIINFKFMEFCKQGDLLFLQLKSNYIDEVILYRDVKFNRNIKSTVVNSCSEKFENLNSEKCLFLNQPLYQSYLSMVEYMEALTKTLGELSKRFTHVYFKFHPRDSDIVKLEIENMVENWVNITIVSVQLDIAESVRMFKPHFAISFFSDALFKLSESGLDMIFLYHLVPTLNKHPVLISLSRVLEELDYQFPKSVLDISRDSKSVKNINDNSLADILRAG